MSVLLAVEWSSSRLSVALDVEGSRLEKSEQPDRFRASLAYELIRSALREAACDPRHVTGLCIGRGPGNYSGMRVALSWAAGFAASGGVDLVVLSSVRAQAWRLWRRSPGALRILGDARRQAWWGMVLMQENQFHAPSPDWSIAPAESWRTPWTLGPTYSAEAERLSGLPDCHTDEPRASDLLDYHAAFPALREEALPLYPHPAV